MKTTGITRPVDSLGRIVIPKELRTMMGVAEGDRMEILVDEEAVVLRKYEYSCIFCGEARNVITYGGKHICKECAAKIGEEAK